MYFYPTEADTFLNIGMGIAIRRTEWRRAVKCSRGGPTTGQLAQCRDRDGHAMTRYLKWSHTEKDIVGDGQKNIDASHSLTPLRKAVTHPTRCRFLRVSLRTQSLHGVNRCGATCWNIGSRQRNQSQHERNDNKCLGIPGTHAIDQAGEQPRNGKGQHDTAG